MAMIGWVVPDLPSLEEGVRDRLGEVAGGGGLGSHAAETNAAAALDALTAGTELSPPNPADSALLDAISDTAALFGAAVELHSELGWEEARRRHALRSVLTAASTSVAVFPPSQTALRELDSVPEGAQPAIVAIHE